MKLSWLSPSLSLQCCLLPYTVKVAAEIRTLLKADSLDVIYRAIAESQKCSFLAQNKYSVHSQCCGVTTLL